MGLVWSPYVKEPSQLNASIQIALLSPSFISEKEDKRNGSEYFPSLSMSHDNKFTPTVLFLSARSSHAVTIRTILTHIFRAFDDLIFHVVRFQIH